MQRLKAIAQSLKVEAHTAWLCARDKNVPWPVRLFGLAIAAYALSPIDLIPDFIPVLGYLDDLIIVPAGVWLLLKFVPEKVVLDSRAKSEQWFLEQKGKPTSAAGLVIILSLWSVAAWATYSLIWG